MVIAEIQSGIHAVEEDSTLCDETNFDKRADAIDFIDFHIIDRIEGLVQIAGPNKNLGRLKQRAEKVTYRLEKIDENLFKQLREKIRSSVYTKSSFREIIRKYLGDVVGDFGQTDKIGYDNLDVFINGLLFDRDIPEPTEKIEPEMVFYQKTPARIVFQMCEQAELREDDVFFDIGSGLGQVAILVNLLSGATAIGIEYEPAYCNYANACASGLNLSNVEFINADACKGDYSLGTVFFLYTPFEGSMLLDMLEILQNEAQKRAIKIFTYGPCSLRVARQTWLNCVNGDGDDFYKLYKFRSLGN